MQHIFFPVFSGCNHAHLEMFCIIKSYCGVVYPPKIFLIKLTKLHFSSFIVRKLFELVWLWKILLLYVKQLNGYLVPHLSGWFLPTQNHFGHVRKNTCRLVSRVLQHMWDRRKSEGDTYLLFLVRNNHISHYVKQIWLKGAKGVVDHINWCFWHDFL